MKVRKTTLEEVQAQGWKPEPHTVALKDSGEWWALSDDDKIYSVVCVSDKHGGKYFSETYTVPEYRHRGYATVLLNVVANEIYSGQKCIAHCLLASRHCYEIAGFKYIKTRHFKYGDQYYMVKEA